MHKKYIELFKELSHATELAAEQVMEYNHNKNDEQGEKTATIMRDDFMALYDKIRAEEFDGVMSKADYARLLVGAYVVIGNLQDRISALQKAISGYQTDIIPKLNKIIAVETDEEAQKIAEEEFVIREE